MGAFTDPVSFQPLLGTISRAWIWWVQELSDALPAGLRARLARPPSELIVQLDPEKIVVRRIAGAKSEVVATALLADAPNDAVLMRTLAAIRTSDSPKVTVGLPADMVLRRRIEFPRSAAGNLRQIVRLDLDRQTPFSDERAAFDVVIRRRIPETGRIEAELAVVRRETVEAALDLSSRLGLQPHAISVLPTDGYSPEFNFLQQGTRAGGFRVREHLYLLLAGAVAILLALNLGLVFWRLDTRVSLLSVELGKARADAQITEKLRAELLRRDREAHLLAAAQEQIGALPVLGELTRILPDTVWLSGFDLAGTTGRIVGFAPSASDIIVRIETSWLFANAHFQGAVTRGEKPGEERFDIGFDVRQGKTQ